MNKPAALLKHHESAMMDAAVPKAIHKPGQLTPYRGSANNFVQSVVLDYVYKSIGNLASVLGTSSLLNVPKALIHVVQQGGSFALNTVGTVFGHGANIASHLTFDSEYQRKEKQKRHEKEEKIDGLASGGSEAAKSLAQGVVGVFDIVTKPIEGAKEEGVGGFFKGLAKGAVGTIVKPVVKVADAVHDLGHGIGKEVGTSGKTFGNAAKRQLYKRKRPPRLLFGELGAISPYNHLHAHIYSYLEQICHQAHIVLPLMKVNDHFLILLGHSDRVSVWRIPIPKNLGYHKFETRVDESVLDAVGEATEKVVDQFLKPIKATYAVAAEAAQAVVLEDNEEEDARYGTHVSKRILNMCEWTCNFSQIVACEKEPSGSIIVILKGETGRRIPRFELLGSYKRKQITMRIEEEMRWEDKHAEYKETSNFRSEQFVQGNRASELHNYNNRGAAGQIWSTSPTQPISRGSVKAMWNLQGGIVSHIASDGDGGPGCFQGVRRMLPRRQHPYFELLNIGIKWDI